MPRASAVFKIKDALPHALQPSSLVAACVTPGGAPRSQFRAARLPSRTGSCRAAPPPPNDREHPCQIISDLFTIPANLAGVPAISVPCGLDDAGLPVGLQFTGRILDEASILKAANAFEQDLAWNARPPLIEDLA